MIIEDEWSLIGEGREGKRVVNLEITSFWKDLDKNCLCKEMNMILIYVFLTYGGNRTFSFVYKS